MWFMVWHINSSQQHEMRVREKELPSYPIVPVQVPCHSPSHGSDWILNRLWTLTPKQQQKQQVRNEWSQGEGPFEGNKPILINLRAVWSS